MTWLKTITIAGAVLLSGLAIADRITPTIDRICDIREQP